MALNITAIKTASDGILQGDNALHTAFPLLIIQTTLILVVTRLLAFAFKPLRQPKVIAEIVGGILLGPSALGRSHQYMDKVFPKWSTPILESVASIGLLFFLFLVGLELDLGSIRRSGKEAFSIALAGISLPFIGGAAVAVILRRTIEGADHAGYAPFLVFMGVSLSITAFPVLARILAELKLLTTKVGETAMAAAAFNDVAAWILLALAVALAGTGGEGGHKVSPLVSLWVLLAGVGFVAFMFLAIKPLMGWMVKRCSAEQGVVDELYITITLAGVLVAGFITDFIGIHSIFGAFIFGLIIPKEGEFAGKLLERIEDFVSGLLLPLYFASSGLKTDVTKIQGAVAWGLLVLVIAIACFGKIFGTFVVAKLCRMKGREALALGILMNTKGLVELIVLNIGKEKKVLNDEMFAILVLMALFTTFITTPLVMAIFNPAKHGSDIETQKRKLQPDTSIHKDDTSSTSKSKQQFRILACAHGPGNVSGLINLIESTRSSAVKSNLKLYIMHLVELTERSSSIMMVHRLRRNGLPFIDPTRRRSRVEVHDRVASAFETYAQLGHVMVRPVTTISALSTMHDDVRHVAEGKRVMMIILPFHKMWRKDEESGEMKMVENLGHGWRGVNQRMLKNSPSSIAVFLDRGFGGGRVTQNESTSQRQLGVCVVFFGGPDDREALELGARMMDHPEIRVTVIRFIETQGMDANSVKLMPSPEKCSDSNYTFSVTAMNTTEEKAEDEVMVEEFRNKWEGTMEFIQKQANNIEEAVLTLGRNGEYDLIVVGKGRFPSTMVAELADRQAEHAELGPIGDILSSSNNGIVSSVLVVQQHTMVHVEEMPVSRVVDGEDNHNDATNQV
ncbi:cation/H(+) antiporter 20 [Spinacia oleracea]|uniref:Cation/H(+) antiporter 20 n=1 Tax=Spinacia oleracea TaxID=3562 RepID=A0A9R0IRU7_SPIOL|nr:cation/H(+) antiporter 20 [Spinacia oleracea]